MRYKLCGLCYSKLFKQGVLGLAMALFGFLHCLFSCLLFAAEDGRDEPTSWALVVGVDSFVNAKQLNFCSRDALAIKQHLVRYAGFQEDHVFLCHSAAKDQSLLPFKSNIEAHLEALFDGKLLPDGKRAEPLVRAGDTVLFVFSGHGMEINGCGYLFPTDGHPARAEESLLRLDDIYGRLLRSPATVKLVLIDACRNDPLGLANAAALDPTRNAPPEKIWVLSGCDHGEVSRESTAMGHSVLFYYILEGLRGSADFDADQQVSVTELWMYAKSRVSRYCKLEYGKKQTPVLSAAGRQFDGNGFGFPFTPSITNSLGMELVPVLPGRFVMGSPKDETNRERDEEPHRVTITSNFYMSRHEVTQGQYKTVMEDDSPENMATAQPVENVSWKDAHEFCRRLSSMPKEIAAKRRYRLPTEAEWEYACRAGMPTAFHYGYDLLPVQANFHSLKTRKVGSYYSNAFGLFDMHGNVAEWCHDHYSESFYTQSPEDNPVAFEGKGRVYRGGGFQAKNTITLRSAFRGWAPEEVSREALGFRIVCEIDQ